MEFIKQYKYSFLKTFIILGLLNLFSSCKKFDKLLIPTTESDLKYELHINYNYSIGYFQIETKLGFEDKIPFGSNILSQGLKVIKFNRDDIYKIHIYRLLGNGDINLKYLDIRNNTYRDIKLTKYYNNTEFIIKK